MQQILVEKGEYPDQAVLDSTGTFTGLDASIKFSRPRWPYCNRPWCPGNRVYTNKGYYVDATIPVPERTLVKTRSYTFSTRIRCWLYRLIPAGFYHKKLVKSLWSRFWSLIPRFSGYEGIGSFNVALSPSSKSLEYVKVDVLVVGGGLAGLAAAVEAANIGAEVLLVESRQIGGFLRLLSKYVVSDLNPSSLVSELVSKARNTKNIRVLENSKYVGLYDEGHVVVSQDKILVVSADGVVYATGSVAPPPLFENNDLPGIVSLEYGVSLIKEHGYKPGKIVVLGGGAWSLEVAAELSIILKDKGSKVSLLTTRKLTKKEESFASENDLEITTTEYVKKAIGTSRVNAVITDSKKIEANLVLSSVEEYPDANVIYSVGGIPSYCEKRGVIVPRTTKFLEVTSGVFAAGGAVGETSIEATLLSGKLAGAAAAWRSGFPVADRVKSLYKEYEGVANVGISCEDSTATCREPRVWLSKTIEGMQFIDLDEDVLLIDIIEAWEKGYKSMESIKRITGLGTGPEQGRFSAHTATLILSKIKGEPVASIGLFKARPPHYLPAFSELVTEV